MFLNSLEFTAQLPTTKNYPAQNVNSAKVEKPDLPIHFQNVHMHYTTNLSMFLVDIYVWFLFINQWQQFTKNS